MKMMMVPAGLFNTPFKPTMQIMCKWQVFLIKDGLPKFKDSPKDFGGSDEKVDDSFEPDPKEAEETVQCYCGECKVTVKGEPAMQVFCHCDDCRKWGGGIVQAAKLYPADNVTVTGDLVFKPYVEGAMMAQKLRQMRWCCGRRQEQNNEDDDGASWPLQLALQANDAPHVQVEGILYQGWPS